jgi:hypothetical protein
MFRVARYTERPEDFPETDPPIYFYGHVIEHALDSLKGCSGGPIVSLSHPDCEGRARYHLVAMQVTTMGSDIKGMLMPPLGELVRDLLRVYMRPAPEEYAVAALHATSRYAGL